MFFVYLYICLFYAYDTQESLYFHNRWSQNYTTNYKDISKDVIIYVMAFLRLNIQFVKIAKLSVLNRP